MKKNALVLFFTWITSMNFSQIEVKISGNIFNLGNDSIAVSQIIGNKYVDYVRLAVDKKGDFSVSGKVPGPDYYVFRVGNQHTNLILRDKSDIKIYGDAKNFTAYNNIVNSDESKKLNELVVVLQNYNLKRDSATAYLRARPDQEQAINQSFLKIYYEFNDYKNNFFKENQNSPALLPLISQIDTDKEFPLYEEIVRQLVVGFPESQSIQQVKAQYEQLKVKKEAMSFLDEGKIAPDFTQAKMDGTPMKLSDLRGKVVLIDFWASWCGPCRQENPNVVKLYERYKDAGFTVMSVSLDKDIVAWQKAIEKDKLSWPNHVSDLKQWSNEVAQLYRVSGIPFTVLIDKEGKIIGKNLRGIDLENKLKSIFEK
jgi:thiol-disulfide isomerase/thioredoxin